MLSKFIDDYDYMDNIQRMQDYDGYNLGIQDVYDYLDYLSDDDYNSIGNYYDDLYARNFYDDLDSLLDDDYMDMDMDYYNDQQQNLLDFLYNYLLFEELMFDPVDDDAKESKDKKSDKPMAGGDISNGYSMYKYKKGGTTITIKKFALFVPGYPPKKATPYSAISEFIGDFVVYETLKEVFTKGKYKYPYNKLFSHFWQRLKIDKVTFEGQSKGYPSIDYSRQYIEDVAINKEIYKVTNKADLFEMTANDDHFRQIAVIILIDIINMNDDRFYIDKYFLKPPNNEYHGNLFLGKDIPVIIPFDNGYAREYIEDVHVSTAQDVKSRFINKAIGDPRVGQRFKTSNKKSINYLIERMAGFRIWKEVKISPKLKELIIKQTVRYVTKYGLKDGSWQEQVSNKIGKTQHKDVITKVLTGIAESLKIVLRKDDKELRKYFPLPLYIKDYRKQFARFTSNLIESAYYLVWKDVKGMINEGNGQLFRELTTEEKNRAVKIIYQTWLEYGRIVCKILPEKLKHAMIKLTKIRGLHEDYIKEEEKVKENIWRFPDYLPVFKELYKVVADNAKLLKHSIPTRKFNERIFEREMKRLSPEEVNKKETRFSPK